MADDLGTCTATGCTEAAVHVVTIRGLDRRTGQPGTKRLHVCDDHARDLTAPCDNDGCNGLGWYVVAVSGTGPSGAPKETEVRLCHDCWQGLQASATVTIDGHTMVHDGQGNLKRLPPTIGQG